jgi:hypothetical protein
MVALKRAVVCTADFPGRSDSNRLGSAGSEWVVGRADLRRVAGALWRASYARWCVLNMAAADWLLALLVE